MPPHRAATFFFETTTKKKKKEEEIERQALLLNVRAMSSADYQVIICPRGQDNPQKICGIRRVSEPAIAYSY